jgi:hypothetical protein
VLTHAGAVVQIRVVAIPPNPRIARGVCISVNDRVVDAEVRTEGSEIVYSGQVTEGSQKRGFTRVRITVPETVTMSDLDARAHEPAQVGIAVASLTLTAGRERGVE